MTKLCSAPYVGIQIDTDKTVRACCMAKAYRDNDGNVLKFSNDFSWEKLKQLDSYKKITNTLDSGEYPTECKACETDPIPVAKTYLRRYDVELYSNDPKLKYIDLRLSNLCNLRCRMCHSGASNQIQKDYNNYAKEDLGDRYLNEYFQNKTYEEDQRYIIHKPEDVIERLEWNDLQELAFYGGEPLLIKEYEVVMNHLIKNDVAKNVVYKMHTNCTKWTPEYQNMMNEFKNQVVYFSMEGIGPVNDYIRHPSRWKTLEENFLRYVEHCKVGYFGISIALTPVSLYYLHEVVEWVDEVVKKTGIKKLDLRPSWCFHPDPQLANVLTDAQRQRIVEQLDTDKARKHMHSHESICNKILNVKYDEEMKNRFVKMYNFLDKRRRQPGLELLPDFFKEVV